LISAEEKDEIRKWDKLATWVFISVIAKDDGNGSWEYGLGEVWGDLNLPGRGRGSTTIPR